LISWGKVLRRKGLRKATMIRKTQRGSQRKTKGQEDALGEKKALGKRFERREERCP